MRYFRKSLFTFLMLFICVNLEMAMMITPCSSKLIFNIYEIPVNFTIQQELILRAYKGQNSVLSISGDLIGWIIDSNCIIKRNKSKFDCNFSEIKTSYDFGCHFRVIFEFLTNTYSTKN